MTAVSHDTAVLTEGERYVHARIDNLLTVADRFDRPGGSRALARRARDKAAGMEIALAHLRAEPPQDDPQPDEREALAEVLAEVSPASEALARRIADAVLAAGFRRHPDAAAHEARALREAADRLADDTWEGVGPNLHLDYYPAAESIRAWLHGRADRADLAEPTPGSES